MTTPATLRAANAANLRQANRRVEALRLMKTDVSQRIARGDIDPVKVKGDLANLDRALETLNQEVAIRRGLDTALDDAHRGDPREARRWLAQLDALRARGRAGLYRNGAKVGDPCLACLERAFQRRRRVPFVDYFPTPVRKPLDIPPPPKAEDRPPLKKRKKRELVKADPEMLRQVNDQLNTRLDFDALAQFEGGQWVDGYVPPAGKSGVTIATGFDVGQWKPRELRNKLGLPEDLASRLDPYTELIRGDAAAALRRNPLSVTRDEANLIDQSVHRYFVEQTMDYWDGHRPPGGAAYQSLTSAQQTVLMSRTFHQGVGMPRTGVARDFYAAAQRGDWGAAESHLRNYRVTPDWYRERVAGEARLLRDERRA